MTDTTSTPDRPVPLGPRARLAQLVADAVDAVDGVRRCVGPGVEVATQYRGGRVIGVRLAADKVVVCVTAQDVRVKALADAVRASVLTALGAAGDARPVDVTVTDLDLPREHL